MQNKWSFFLGHPELKRAPMDICPEAGVVAKGAVDFNAPNNHVSPT